MNESTFAELAAGYALSALSPADRREFEVARAAHPEWEHHLVAQVDTAAALSDTIGEVMPPPAVREALLARIAVTPQGDDVVTPASAPGSVPEEDFAAAGPAPVAPVGRPKQRWFALAASVAVLLALGFGAVVLAQQLTRPAAVVALEQIEDASDARSASVALTDGGEATAHWSPSLGEAVFVSEGLPALEDDQTFELWFVRDEGAVSAGTFAADGGSATALLAGAYEPGDVIAVTVEPSGGAPGGVPTGDPILAIATA